ncbi:MAG: IPT/TIG domain-containing protein [Candidatus Auribacterota bacterium]
MKTTGFMLLLILGLLTSLYAYDADNDGDNDDPYRPGFKSYASTGASFYINMLETDPLFSVVLQNDSNAQYAFSTSDGFALSNDRDGVMEPLEMGSAAITIDTTQLPGQLTENMGSGALRLQVIDSSEYFKVRSAPVSIAGNSGVTVNFTVNAVSSAVTSVPLVCNLYNTSSGYNMILSSAKYGQYMSVDDRPFGHVTGINSVLNHEDMAVISDKNLIINGWAFDDNQNMSISLKNIISGDIINSTVVKSLHAINSEIPFWGSNYKSGFELKWERGGASGYFEMSVNLNDGEHNIQLPAQKVFLNNAPDGEILSPVADTFVPSTGLAVSGWAQDLDTNVSFGSYISCVEVYVDDMLIRRIPNSEPENETVYFSFIYDDMSVLTDGRHKFYAAACDSFGARATFGERSFMVVSSVPVITSVTPRIGPWRGNTTVTITGEHMILANNLIVGQAQNELKSVMLSDTAFTAMLPSISLPQSRYVDVKISNPLGSFIFRDGYHFIQAELARSISNNPVVDLIYDNCRNQLLIVTSSGITRYGMTNYMPYYLDALAVTSGDSAYLIDTSCTEDAACVVTAPYYMMELIDLTADNRLLPLVSLPDTGVDSLPSSLAWLQDGTILVGTTGIPARLFGIKVDRDYASHSVTEYSVGDDYESVDVVGSSNKSVAYILCKDNDTGGFDLYRYDSKTSALELVTVNYSLAANELSELRIAPDFNGSEFLMYTGNTIKRFASSGEQLDTADYGAGLVLYDELRPVFYTITAGDTYFTLRSVYDLKKGLTYCHFPESATAREIAGLDWKGDKLFAVNTEGLSVTKLSDIYPHIEYDPVFVQHGSTVTVKSHKSGTVSENVAVVVNNEKVPALHVSSDNDTHVFSVNIPMDNDTSGKIYTTVSDIPGAEQDLLMMTKLFDKLANQAGLDYFAPSGLFYDEVRSDLYAFSPTQTGPLSIVRIHLNVDNDGSVQAVRKSVPAGMQVVNPICMARTHDYILVVSLVSRMCTWFNVDEWDNAGNQQVREAAVSRYISPSGAVGYSPADSPDVNYAYVWNSVSTGSMDIFQLNLDTGVFKRCPLVSPHTTDIYIEHNAEDSSLDRAYAVSGRVWGCDSNYITVFNPNHPAESISAITRMMMDTSSRLYKVFSNDDSLFAAFVGSTGLALIAPDESGVGNHDCEVIYDNDSITSKFFGAGDEYLAFSGRNPDKSFNLNIMDVNFLNDSLICDPYFVLHAYNPANSAVYDVKIIENKLFAIIGNEIYVIDLTLSGRKNQ